MQFGVPGGMPIGISLGIGYVCATGLMVRASTLLMARRLLPCMATWQAEPLPQAALPSPFEPRFLCLSADRRAFGLLCTRQRITRARRAEEWAVAWFVNTANYPERRSYESERDAGVARRLVFTNDAPAQGVGFGDYADSSGDGRGRLRERLLQQLSLERQFKKEDRLRRRHRISE